jgi:hypothetical protein
MKCNDFIQQIIAVDSDTKRDKYLVKKTSSKSYPT